MVCSVIALASTFLSEHYGGPLLLYALLIGLAFHFLHSSPDVKAGVDFCGRTVLRLGVALLGARITFGQVMQLGPEVALVVFLGLCLTIVLGVWAAKLLGRTRDEGLLSGGSVAICGASAALAISAVLPQTKENQRFTLLAVVSVTVLSTVAMVLYPLLIQLLEMAQGPAGVFLGGTIHDVAQVVAAGMIIGPEAGDIATVVKLFRVMLLVPVVMVISFLYRNQQNFTEQDVTMPLVPGFLLAFLVMMLLATSQQLPAEWVRWASDFSRICLVVAIAAAGIKTSIEDILKLGWQPLTLFVAETLFIGVFVLACVLAFGLAH
ncbi:MAG: hypothetical protein RL295_895 [Pseudomonadota bacterium]|jgi:uncharacterized integral membrane protein (TIGR00698 family)